MDNYLRAGGIHPRRQSGVVLVAFAALLAIVSVGLLVDKLSTRAQRNADRDASSSEVLARAKADLIAWSVSHPAEPGRLPWPDRETDGDYDGRADCVTAGFSNFHLLGRLPHAGDVTPCTAAPLGNPLVDGYGEPLFYAVSRNLLWNRDQNASADDPPINPGLLDGGASYSWLTVRDQNGNVLSNRVAAVIIAPGDVVGNQARSGTAPPREQYLDSVTVGGTPYSNSDSDLDFIVYPDSRKTPTDSDAFNDRLVYITIDELMRPVEKRVLGDAAVVLEQYRAANGRFPWLSPYRDPTLYTAGDTLTGRVDSVSGGDHIIDADGNFPSSGLDDHVIVNVTRGTEWEIQDQHAPNDLHVKGSPDFQPGDAYNIRPAYNGVWGRREGHIPYIDGGASEQYAFTTGFTLTWQNGAATGLPSCGSVLDAILGLILGAIGCGQVQNSGYESGTFVQPPPVVPPTTDKDGECIWRNDADRADCHCHTTDCDRLVETRNNAYTVQLCTLLLLCTDLQVTRELTYTFDFSGNGSITSVGNVRTRRVASTSPQTIGIVDTVDYSGDTVTIWNGTVVVPAGDYVMDGIYYEMDDTGFPPYFFTNRWHHYIYGKIGADLVATNTNTGNPSDGDCETVAPPCLDLDIGGSAVRSDVQAALVGAGGQLAGQTRSNGSLSDYFESDNAAQGNDTVARGVIAAGFNDQVRVIRPNPP